MPKPILFLAICLISSAFAQAQGLSGKVLGEAIQKWQDEQTELQSLRARLVLWNPLSTPEMDRLLDAHFLKGEDLDELLIIPSLRKSLTPEQINQVQNQRTLLSLSARLEKAYTLSSPQSTVAGVALQHEVQEFMNMNHEAIELLIARTTSNSSIQETHDRKLNEIRGFLTLLAKKKQLQKLGPDFLSTASFLAFGLSKEANPLMAPYFNNIHNPDQLVTIVGFGHLLGGLFYSTLEEAVPADSQAVIAAFFTFMELEIYSYNNSLLEKSGYQPVGFRLVRVKGIGGNVDLFIYPDSAAIYGRTSLMYGSKF